jgi:cytoskeletal protein CcmA (bactofilin family)
MLPNFKKSDAEPARAAPQGPTASVSAMAPRTPAGTMRPGERAAPSVIGADLTISGNLLSRGEVQIDGEVQGDIQGLNVIIGERARITGGIAAEEVVVRGHVLGSIRGKRVMLQATSHVEGDIYHQSLAIEQGAFFEGKSRRSEDPLGVGQQPQASQPAVGLPAGSNS